MNWFYVLVAIVEIFILISHKYSGAKIRSIPVRIFLIYRYDAWQKNRLRLEKEFKGNKKVNGIINSIFQTQPFCFQPKGPGYNYQTFCIVIYFSKSINFIKKEEVLPFFLRTLRTS